MFIILLRRPRRLRINQIIRSLSQDNHLISSQFIQPLFVLSGKQVKQSIVSMPGIFSLSSDLIVNEIQECLDLGIASFILFPVVPENLKDHTASYSYRKNNFYLDTIIEIKQTFGDRVCIITDVAMDPYSNDGHDGLVENGIVLNDQTLPILSQMALAQAEAGSDIIAPSDMMDGRIQHIRQTLDEANFKQVLLMSYTAKYASAFYGPFREALNSTPKQGDKLTYQMHPVNQREALIEAELDYKEGADYLMIKPALPYLDIIYRLKQSFYIPIVAYQVSGEYAFLKSMSQSGNLDFTAGMLEVLYSIKRAGADIIISYASKEMAKLKLLQ